MPPDVRISRPSTVTAQRTTGTDGLPQVQGTVVPEPPPPAVQPGDILAGPSVTKPPRLLERGFLPPAAKFNLPLGVRPTSENVKILTGFDGRTRDEALALVLSNLQTPLARENRHFIERTIRETHHRFMLSLNNCFSVDTPNRKLLEPLATNARITVLGTASSSEPVVYEVERAGRPPEHLVRGPYGLEPCSWWSPKVPVFMRAELRFKPDGLRIQYPQWSSPVLAGPTGNVTEP